MKKAIFIYIILSIFFSRAGAQEMWGMVNSNFAGNIGVDLNPATLVGMPMTSELHFISGDIFLYNNYIYLPKGKFTLAHILTADLGKDELRDRYIDNPLKTAYANFSIKGPSFLWSKDNWGLSIHTAFRNHLSVDDYAFHIAKFNWEGISYQPQHGIWYHAEDFKSAGISYGELGLSFAHALVKNEDDLLSAGISVKRLVGFNSFYAKIDNVDYIIPVKELLIVEQITMEYGHALADFESDREGNPFMIRGGGWSGNFGISYQRGRNDRAFERTSKKYVQHKKYNYRLGFSVMDIGSINWKNDSRRFLFEDASTIWPGIDTVQLKNIDYADSLFSVQFTGDANRSLVADRFRILLPAAISAQFDLALSPRFYANLSAVKGIVLQFPAVRRPDQVALTIRYETRRWEVAVPYSLYEYEHQRLGLAIRYGPLWLGSDRIGAFTGIDESDGIDFYFALKWAFFNGSRSGRQTKCFAF